MFGSLDIYFPCNVFGKFDSSKIRCCSGALDCLNQLLFVEIAFALLIGRVASLAEHNFECGAIEQQPAFDMRVGNGKNYRSGRVLIVEFFDAIFPTFAVGVCSDDD